MCEPKALNDHCPETDLEIITDHILKAKSRRIEELEALIYLFICWVTAHLGAINHNVLLALEQNAEISADVVCRPGPAIRVTICDVNLFNKVQSKGKKSKTSGDVHWREKFIDAVFQNVTTYKRIFSKNVTELFHFCKRLLSLLLKYNIRKYVLWCQQ